MDERSKSLIFSVFLAIAVVTGLIGGFLMCQPEINKLRQENQSMKAALTHIISQKLGGKDPFPTINTSPAPPPPPPAKPGNVPTHEEIKQQFEEAQKELSK